MLSAVYNDNAVMCFVVDGTQLSLNIFSSISLLQVQTHINFEEKPKH